MLARCSNDHLDRIGLHGMTGEPEPVVSDEDHAEIELQKLRAFKSIMKAQGYVDPVPEPEDQP